MRDSRSPGLRGLMAAVAIQLAQAAAPAQEPKRTPYGQLRYDRSERRRAQWKNEINKRGRSR